MAAVGQEARGHKRKIVAAWLNRDGTRRMTMSGKSMQPVFHDGDISTLEAPYRLRIGDIVVYAPCDLVALRGTLRHAQRPDILIAHRLVGKTRRHGMTYFLIKGDNSRLFDPGWLPEEKIVGRVISVRRDVVFYERSSIRWRVRDRIAGVGHFLRGLIGAGPRQACRHLLRRNW